MAIATVDGRSVVVVCDGVASTANSHLAARAAADAALAVLEPVLYAPAWPDASGIHDLMEEAFAEAQLAVTGVPTTSLTATTCPPRRPWSPPSPPRSVWSWATSATAVPTG